MSEELLAPVFSRHLNSKFRASLNGTNPMDFELIEVISKSSPEGYECFIVRFRGPLEAPLQQATYHLEHDQVPPMEVFCVPSGKDEQGVLLEAVFNRRLASPN